MSSITFIGTLLLNSLCWAGALWLIHRSSKRHEEAARASSGDSEERLERLARSAMAIFRAQTASEAVAVVQATAAPEEISKPAPEDAVKAGDVVGFALEGGQEVDFMTPPDDFLLGVEEDRLLRRE